jgi:putative FmdB family regulatory protein
VPTYQYACTACGEPHEAVQSFTDAPLTDCPACDGRLRKVFSAVGVVFKGSGFYKNDSRKAHKSESSSGESGKGDAAAAKTDGASPKTDGAAAKPKESTPAKSESTPSSSTVKTPAAKTA